ncbi:hypothetical protein [Curtobacterium caseinilyticum]|uniref:Hemagglutinin n=1 Tax=Curtobacterium caseinilyticum TaxID=3055137 RepID=A0ABT7TT20_9MICO|nr:hypothetical protein [Curtobacterium caseinilyticum]MDM7892745.1 hypothetical protein [Curtobacterium caseinilyticum]
MRTTTKDGRRRPFRAALGMVAALAIAVSGLTVGTLLSEETTTQPASAAVASAFDPGNIISDANFYNGSAMSASSVQSFLNSVGANCRQQSGGPVCLKNFTQNVNTIGAVSGRCAAIAGGNKSAATIIAQVGAACGISQKALLVLLQKEQGIVGTNAPTNWMYQHATGFACPDTAPCDPKFRGFAQQVYAAALQFKRYQASPTSWAYQAGRNNSILYNPNAACGRKTVYIKNQATAGLYIYTPYTPNKSSLDNLYGSGDSCGAYGNRNFWRMYTDWFGSPTGGSSPIGSLDTLQPGFRQVTVSGWTADPDTTASIKAQIYVDGAGKASVLANGNRTDLAQRLGANNTAHGYSTTITGLSAGNHNVCVFGINTGAGSNTLLECRNVRIAGGTPTGAIDAASAVAGKLTIRGWAIDGDTASPTQVQVRVGSKVLGTLKADQQKNGLDASRPGYGDKHAFNGSVTGFPAGKQTVTVWAKDLSANKWVQVASKAVQQATGYPWLAVDEVSSKAPGTLVARGWAIDPDTTGTVQVHFYLDGKGLASIRADQTKSGLNSAKPGYGDQHAYRLDRTGISAGTHKLCIIAINVGPGSSNASICKSFSTPTGSPKATIDQGSASGLGAITVSGTAYDPDTVSPVSLAWTVDGKATGVTTSANQTASGFDKAHPGYGDRHGYQQKLTGIGPGKHTVCAVAKNTGGGSDTKTCSTVAATSGNPTLLLDEVSSPATNQVRVRGWAIDPDTTKALNVDVYFNGKNGKRLLADQAKPSLASTYAAFGAGHAFASTVANIPSGATQVCAYAINRGAGQNTPVCRSLTVQ